MTKQTTTMEERFDKKFPEHATGIWGRSKNVKSFIRAEIIRAIEGIGLEERELPLFEEFEVKTQEDLLKVGHRGKVIGYNQAIQELEAQKQALIKKLNQ